MSTKIILSILAVFMFCSACGLFGGEDDDEIISISGKIVFAGADDNQNSQIFTMDADGSNIQQLTFFPGDSEAYAPSWSPDGQQIIFSSFKGGISTGPALWVMDADGSNPRFLYHPDPDNEHVFPIIGNNARWSPDGTKVAFDLCLNCQIYTDRTIWIFDTLTKELTQLTPHEEDPGHPASDGNPFWSPDGTHIVFSSNRDYVGGGTSGSDLYIINVDGSNSLRLTKTGHSGIPVWNVAGNKIDFVTFRAREPVSGIFQLNLEMENTSLIKEDSSENMVYFPVCWSPDKIQLLVQSFEYNQAISRSSNSKLFILNTKSGDFKEIISKNSHNANPAISGADWFVPETQ